MKVTANGPAEAVFEGKLWWAEGERPFRNEQGLPMLPHSFGVRWRPRDHGSWSFSYAWIHGQAVKRDGSVGTTGRYARYGLGDRMTMPRWLRQIAAAGPILAEGTTLELAVTDLTV